jgi:hypothetical protein
MNNASWIQLHPQSAEDIAGGRVDSH